MNEKGDESMKGEAYYSVRMRASENGPHEEGGKHISGGERLVERWTELSLLIEELEQS